MSISSFLPPRACCSTDGLTFVLSLTTDLPPEHNLSHTPQSNNTVIMTLVAMHKEEMTINMKETASLLNEVSPVTSSGESIMRTIPPMVVKVNVNEDKIDATSSPSDSYGDTGSPPTSEAAWLPQRSKLAVVYRALPSLTRRTSWSC